MRASWRANASAISRDRSLLQLLTMVYSKLEYVWASTLRIHSANTLSPLYIGVSTATSGCFGLLTGEILLVGRSELICIRTPVRYCRCYAVKLVSCNLITTHQAASTHRDIAGLAGNVEIRCGTVQPDETYTPKQQIRGADLLSVDFVPRHKTICSCRLHSPSPFHDGNRPVHTPTSNLQSFSNTRWPVLV